VRNNPKRECLLEAILVCLESDNFLDTRHANDRLSERGINRAEVNYVLRHGRHEKGKDKYVADFQAWNYSIRGLTIDRRELRVIVSFEGDMLLVITAIDLTVGHGKKN